MARHGISPERRTGGGGIWLGYRFKLADSNFVQAWRKRWLVMEFPQKEEEEREEEEGEELRSVLVRVYSSHIHENRKAD
jgi:hypothetical protein